MAEAVGIVASIVAIVQIADRIGEICRYYIQSSSDAPRDLRSILLEVSSVKALLENLQFLCDVNTAGTLADLKKPEGLIDECRACLRSLLDVFPEQSQSSGATKRQRLIQALAWPLRKSKADKLLDELARIKSTLTLSIIGDTARDLKEIKSNVQATRAKIDASELGRVLDWLERTNPSRLHNKACALHEEKTTEWLFRHPQWEVWAERLSKERLLWIHGTPGAGKTILFSYLVERLQELVQQSSASKDIVVYYYCYFGHGQDESVPFLRWVISQLCRKARFVSEPMFKLYELRQEPARKQLLEELVMLVDLFGNITIAIDALDESEARRQILTDLRHLSTNESFKNVRIVATSREYLDIETMLYDVSLPVPMSNPSVEADIKLFVHSVLTTSPDFSSWDLDLREDTEGALARGAKGMFRWAVCQLDILRRLVTRDAIAQALMELPETLDETYERIFTAIPVQNRELVKKILLVICGNKEWICNDHDSTLNSSIVLHLAGLSMLCVNTLDSTLKELCGCLVSIHDDGHVSLAHYTVYEFMVSDRLRDSTRQSSQFWLCEKNILARSAALYLRHLKSEEADDWPDDARVYLHTCATMILDEHECNESLWGQDQHLRTAFDILSTRRYITWDSWSTFRPVPITDVSTKDIPSTDYLIFTNMIHLDRISDIPLLRFLEQADLSSLWQSVYTPLPSWDSSAALLSILEFLVLAQWHTDRYDDESQHLKTGNFLATFFARCPDGPRDAYFGIASGRLLDWSKFDDTAGPEIQGAVNLVSQIFDKPQGYNHPFYDSLSEVNPSGVLKTPLQIATEHSNVNAVCVLLGVGADPRGMGDLNGLSMENAISLWADHTPLEICKILLIRANFPTKQRLQIIEHVLHHAEEWYVPRQRHSESIVIRSERYWRLAEEFMESKGMQRHGVYHLSQEQTSEGSSHS